MARSRRCAIPSASPAAGTRWTSLRASKILLHILGITQMVGDVTNASRSEFLLHHQGV